MALIHDVIDSDVRFLIDPAKRTISNQNSTKLILIQGDHNSERFSFEIPRTVEGHDMSLCNVIRIHYINTCSKTRSTSCDIYEPDDMTVSTGSTGNTEVVHFSWLIANTATVYAGSLAFAIEFQCVVGDKIVYSWHTAPNTTITISDGISNTEAIVEDYSDILTTWWLRIFANATLPIEIHDMESFAALNGETKNGTLYLLEDDPTLEEIEKVIETMEEHLEQYETLDKNLTEHLEKYTELDKNIADHFEEYESLLVKINELEERVNALEKGSSTGECEHNYTSIVTDPTCNAQGYTTHTCTKCGHVYKDSYTPVSDTHTYVDGKCTVCGASETTTSCSHTNTVVIPATAATCTTDGATEGLLCNDCNTILTKQVTIPATGVHTYVDGKCTVCGKSETACEQHTWVYTQQGLDLWDRRCTVCGANEYDVEYLCTDGTKHTWVETDPIAATCTTPSITQYYCSKCDAFKTGETVGEALGHTLVFDTSVNETCGTAGSITYRCSRCTTYTETTPVPATGNHTWSEAIYDAAGYFEPTCTETGYAGYVCTKCGGEKSEVVPALQHSYTSVVTAPTCGAQGYTTYTCTVCGYDYTANEVPATGNHSDEEVSTTAATCTKTGSVTYKCSVCGYEHSETIPVLQHSYNETTVPATCTTAGSTTYTCTREGCGYSYTVTIDPLGHDYVEEPVNPDDRNDDVSSDGYVDVCTRCGDRNYENHT